jgi:hypothetical protein
VTREISALAKEYHCREVIGDNYSADWVIAAFRDCGINYRRADKVKSELYLERLALS